MSTVTGNNTLNLNFNQALSYGAGLTQNVPIPFSMRSIFATFGTLLDQCNLICVPRYTFVASTTQVMDLKVMTDIFGAAAAFARVRMFACKVNSVVNADKLLLGANGTTDWLGLSSTGSTVPVYSSTAANDGFVIWQMPNTTGAAVGASTKSLKMDPGSSAFTADFLIAGCDA